MSNELLDKKLSFIRHELRTPINAIIGYSEILLEDVEENEHAEYVPDLKKIREASGRLQNMISDLLAITQFEQPVMPTSKSASEQPALVDDAQTPDWSHVQIPDALFERLNAAAEIHNVTEVKASLEEVAKLNSAGKDMADHLQGFIKQYDMDSVLIVLSTLQPA